MSFGPGKSAAGKTPRGTEVFIEEEFDENGKSMGFFVKTKTNPPKKVTQQSFGSVQAAEEWIVANGYALVPRP